MLNVLFLFLQGAVSSVPTNDVLSSDAGVGVFEGETLYLLVSIFIGSSANNELLVYF